MSSFDFDLLLKFVNFVVAKFKIEFILSIKWIQHITSQ